VGLVSSAARLFGKYAPSLLSNLALKAGMVQPIYSFIVFMIARLSEIAVSFNQNCQQPCFIAKKTLLSVAEGSQYGF